MADENRRIDANPTKDFFVNMITRDISFEDCIFDLIDNAVDGASRSENSPPIDLDAEVDLSKYAISISISPERFSITDNCGGMTLDQACDHAFNFGRKPNKFGEKYSIGVYGIGMKRAVFKLGKDINIKSTFQQTDESRMAFAVPICVDTWLTKDEPPWDFDIEESRELGENGVEIIIRNLTSAAQTSFENPEFIENLKRMIARDYLLYLRCGLKIIVNDKPVTSIPIEFRQSEEFVPMRHSYQDKLESDDGTDSQGDDMEDSVVAVEIIAGMAGTLPEDSEPDEMSDGDKRYGWYVACNGRIVLAADKTDIAGWGTSDWPQWHRQYSGFLGFVLFTSPKSEMLPLTTTKRSVDSSSKVFARARLLMRDASREWIQYTNERKNSLEIAKLKENETKSVSISALLKQGKRVRLPELEKKTAERHANVRYSVPIQKVRNLANEFGDINMPYREVGRKSFDHAYEDFVGDD